MKRCATLSTVLTVVLSILATSCGPAGSVPPTTNMTEPAAQAPSAQSPTPGDAQAIPPTCAPSSSQLPATPAAPEATLAAPDPAGAFVSGQYRNLFKEMLNKSDAEIQAKLEAAWQQLFYGDDDSQRVYYPVGTDMAYVMDIGNDDVRSEGMSYGMMIAVQMDKQEEFDRIWKWAKTYMYQKDGPYKGYFAWHCKPNGEKLAANPASDGEEWFAMALFFASGRWGDGTGDQDYRAQAQAILDTMLHKEEQKSDLATNMFDAKTKQVVFVPMIGPNSTFTDPSYHLPAYYELWARWADKDNEFWTQAAQASREFFKKCANPQTGLMPDYAGFDGAPTGSEHKDFRFDAFRTISNIAVDHAWFGVDNWQHEQCNRQLEYFEKQGIDQYVNQYSLEGDPLSSDRSTGLIAMNAVAALVATTDCAPKFVQALWDAPIPSGKWRYYDGLLYTLALLHVSGNFRIYPPAE
jgi:oligosaccharide reducing-end xylanase